MEAIIAWIIYLGLQCLELCNCFPVTPHSEDGAPAGPELGALAPSLLAALSLLTAVLLLAGCSWCRRIIKPRGSSDVVKEVVVGQPIPLENSGSGAAIETGIHNPLNDIRFPITAAISSQSPRFQPAPDTTPARAPLAEEGLLPHLPHLNLRQVEVDNQDFEDNNNGPISEQELENIVNNNAENYIVSEYENRNLNLEAVGPRAVEVFEQPLTSRNLTPAHASARGDGPTQDVLAEHKDWFDNPNSDFPRNQLQYLQTIGRGWFGRIVEGEAHSLISLSDSDPSPGTSPLHLPHSPNAVTRVAVKILDENVTVTDKCTFLEEARLYRDLRHESLLKFCGRSLTQDPWLILFEHCPLGDLKQFLQSNKSQVTSLSQKGLPLKFQCEIAAALEYLHMHDLAHPDVACHSCLVAEGPSARLGDYGDAPRRHPGDFHSAPGQGPPRPLRWLPPEAAHNLRPTLEGNMWSLGVLLWESCSWGALPYEGLSHEQVLAEVMRPAGPRLPPPPHYTEYVTYLYNVMQSCWLDDPGQRCASSQVASYLQNIYSNYHLAASQPRESITHDFEARWHSLKPNSIPKVDNGLPHSTAVASPLYENFYELKFPPSDIIVHDSSPIREHQFVYHNLAISSDTLTGDELSIKAKSDSLTNLHGSLESVLEKNREKLLSVENPPLSATPESSAFWETSLTENPLALSDTSSDKLLFDSEVSQVAPWLRDVPFTTPEDMSYIKNVSDVISDFDNMLSSEKTSSSESSHQTSPSRDVSGNPKATLVSASEATQPSQMYALEDPEVSRGDSISDLTRCDSDSPSEGTLNDANIDSDIVNSPLHHVPEISNMDSKESYPTLDFRLIKMPEMPTYPAGLPIFQIDCEEDVQLFDSLQDSSYTPDPLKDNQIKTESGEGDSKLGRQCSSGSETEDEIWKKRIELGTLTEKIKLKSKSVTDFMVLTHIDTDFTDMESEETSFTSMEGYGNMFFDMIQKKFKQDSPPKESSLPNEKYLSFPRNYSSTLLSRVESLRPDLDLYRLWKSHRTMAVKSLRLNKSLGDLTQSKTVTVKELQIFKRNLDFFLDTNNSVQKKIASKNGDFVKAAVTSNPAKPTFQHELQPADEGDQTQPPIHFSLPGNFSFHLPNKDRMFPSPSAPLGTDLLNVTSEEENLKFSSNFNDINLNLYAGDHSQGNTMDDTQENDLWESTKFMNLPENYNLDSQIYSDAEPKAINLYDSENISVSNREDISVVKSEIIYNTKLNIEPSVAEKIFHENVQTEQVSTSTPVSNQISGPINDAAACQNTEQCTDGVNAHVNQSIQNIMHNEILNLTTTLAIAENENNLNIEYSGPLETEQVTEEAQEGSQGLVSNEHSLAEENIETDDQRKVDNVSTETNSLLTGTESGIESQFETMDKLSQEYTSELTLEQGNASTQRSDFEPANDGSLSNDLESGIVSLDHSDPNLASHENCFENDMFNIVDSKPTHISDINQMLIESENFLPPPFKESTESSVSDDNNLLTHQKLNSDFVITAGDFPEVKQINVAEQNIATCDHVVSFDQKIEELETVGNLVMDMGSDDIVPNLNETIRNDTIEKTNKEITQTIDKIISEAESKVVDLNAHNEEKELAKETTFNADISTALLESEGYKQEETSAETTTKKNNTPEDDESMNLQFVDTDAISVETHPKEFLGETQLATQRNDFDQSESRDELSQNLDLELQRLDAENEDESNYYSDENNSEPQYVNVGSTSQLEESSSGWFLHPKEGVEDPSKVNLASDGVQQNFELAHNFAVSNGSSTESLTENSGSERYTVDAESVEALRNELELKLPLAQKMGQIRHDNIADSLGESRKDWSVDMSDPEMDQNQRGAESFVEPTVKKMTMMHSEPGTSSGSGCLFSEDALVEEVKSSPQQVRNEVLIHYNMYGVVPLSPIQEESWSEFSEMEKAADKTDTSNSLSLGEQTSNIENILPFDGVCQAVNTQLVSRHEERHQNWSDDDTHSDCSNRTFVLNEAGPSNLDRQHSLSADSLDSFDGEHMGLDDDNAPPVVKKKMTPVLSQFPPHTLQTSDLLSPFYEEHSHNKSTEEISQNVDNLLENISKTLENASKMSLSSESNEFINQEIPIDDFLNQEMPIDDLLSQEVPLELSLNESDDGSKTYVIEDKKATIKDMSIDFNRKVAELHDDLSNVSKVSQPSFISELTSPNDSDVKPSDRSISINLHTKTPSMDSWCSNDTLFNVEENFDDVCSTETLTSPVPRDAFAESQTFTLAADTANVVESTPLPVLKCGQALPSNMLPAVEMVRGCPEVFHAGHHGEEPEHFYSAFQQDSAKNSPDLPKLLLLNNMEPTVEGASFNSMTNKSEDSLTAESGISILVNSEVKFSAPLDEVLKDSPVSAAESGVLTLPTIQFSNSDEVIDISHEDTPQMEKLIESLSSPSRRDKPPAILGETFLVDSQASMDTGSYINKDTSQMDKILESLLSSPSREGKPPAILGETFTADSQASVDTGSYTNEITSVSGDQKDDFQLTKPAETRNAVDNKSYLNSFEESVKTAMTSTPTSVDHMQKNESLPLAEAAESPDNIIDEQFQFLEGIVDSSISYISFKDDAGQNFITHEKNLGSTLPSTTGKTSQLPDISTKSLISIPSIVVEDLDLLADPNSDELEDIKKHSTGLEDISGPAFSTIHSSGDLGEKQELSSEPDMIKNSTGLVDIGSPDFSIIPTTDVDIGLHVIKINKNSTGLEDIEPTNISVITSPKIHLSDTPNMNKKTELTGLKDNASPNFSIISPTETNIDSNLKHGASVNLGIFQEPQKNSTGLEDIGSPNFSIIPALGTNLIDSNISTEPDNQDITTNTQDLKKNSTGLENISSPNFSMIASGTNLIDSRTARLETVNTKSNSTGLGDLSSPNFSIIQAPGQSSTADKTHNSSQDSNNIPERSINSLDLYEMSSSSFNDLSFPESTNQVRDWHVNNVTVSFLENERQFNSLTPKAPIFLLENGSLSNDIKSKHETDHIPSLDSFMENVTMAPQQISDESILDGQIANVINSTGLVNISSPNLSKIHHQIVDVNELKSEDFEAYPSSLSYQQSHALDEYAEYTGLNMGAQNLDRLLETVAKETPTFETFKETAVVVPQDLSSEAGPFLQQKRNSPLSQIHFSGPSNDDLMSTSFNEMSPVSEHAGPQEERPENTIGGARAVEDISHVAPERLKDWDSESDDSNCSSTSSGDFVWKEAAKRWQNEEFQFTQFALALTLERTKILLEPTALLPEGGKEQLLSVSALPYSSPGFTQKNQGPGSRGASQSFADIPEEDTAGGDVGEDGEGEGEDDEDEEVEFVPSSWDCRATPTKSALKSPETSQMEEEPVNSDNRKRVMFKKQKYQCIYEYPREILSHDDDDMQTLPDYSTYSDWHPFGSGNGSYMAVDFENFLNAHPGDLQQPSSDLLSEDDFYISSSTRPFETYNLISSSSQFFPGQHLSLFSNMKPYGGEASEIDDYDSLPTIPTEYEIQQSTLNNAGTNTENDHVITKPSFDYVTPDSGTEDITPGSLIDYDFKDSFAKNEPFNKKDVTHIDIGTNSGIEDTLTEQEILLNSTNKNGSFGRAFCGTLILPERGSSGSLTPSSPSPSPSLSGHSSHSSGSTSPLPPPSGPLGGLRHTRDKLKLDLPPSPLAIILTSGKNANKDVKIFDFKNMDSFQSDDLDKTLSESASDVSSTNTLVENTDFKPANKTSRLLEEPSPKGSDKQLDSELCNVEGLDPSSLELDDTKSLNTAPFSPISMIGKLIPDKSSLIDSDTCSYKPQGDGDPDGDGETGQFDTSTLQKAVVPMGTETSWRKASLEPVKGEGTLLDSGDEDSGIGSSAYATLERKLDSKEIEPEASKSTNERHLN